MWKEKRNAYLSRVYICAAFINVRIVGMQSREINLGCICYLSTIVVRLNRIYGCAVVTSHCKAENLKHDQWSEFRGAEWKKCECVWLTVPSTRLSQAVLTVALFTVSSWYLRCRENGQGCEALSEKSLGLRRDILICRNGVAAITLFDSVILVTRGHLGSGTCSAGKCRALQLH